MNVEKLFGTKDLYQILNIDRTATIAEVKKNYYKLARIYHPDKVTEAEKLNANEKFNILHQAYLILSDADKRVQYDATPDLLFAKATVAAQWEFFIRPMTSTDIDDARKKYQNSENEKNDIIREYNLGKGSMIHMMNNLPFMRYEDEPRLLAIINELVTDGLIEKMKIRKIPK